jgi:hypothetical protein
MAELLCCPQVPMPEGISYENVFRVVIVQFHGQVQFLRRLSCSRVRCGGNV